MSKKSIDKLMSKGFDLLEIEDFESAIKVGNQLQARRHTSAFEILASAYVGLGNTQRAVEVLEEGVKHGPTVWLLWQLLGNCRSDLELYEVAQEAYDQALKCPGVNNSSVYLNVGILLSRQKRFDEAIKQLTFVEDEELIPRAQSQRLHILNEQRAYEDAIRLGEEAPAGIDRIPDSDVRSAIQVRLGHAYWFGRKDRERALQLARDALAQGYTTDEALWLIREVDREVSPTAKYYRLLIEGTTIEPDKPQNELGFFSTYDVVADSVDEALNYVRRLHLSDVGGVLSVEESEVLESRPSEPKGVYARTGRALFRRKKRR